MGRIAVINQKGGVGKTAAAVNLAAAFLERGLRTLFVDCDAQGDSSRLYCPTEGTGPGLHQVLSSPPAAGQVIQAVPEGPDLVAADDRLHGVDRTHGYHGDRRARQLGELLDQVRDRYDVVVLDCPPRPQLSSFAALVAANLALVPVEPGEFSLAAMARLLAEIRQARERHNPRLRAACFLSRVRPTTLARVCRDLLRTAAQDSTVLASEIPELAAYAQALSAGQSVLHYQPRGDASTKARALADEVLQLLTQEKEHGSEQKEHAA